MKFCMLTVGGKQRTSKTAKFAFFALHPSDIFDSDKQFQLSPQEIALLNPNTRTTPIFRSTKDAELTKAIYQRVPVLIRELYTETRNGQEVTVPEVNPWGIKFMLMFMMNTGSRIFKTAAQLESEGWTRDGNRYLHGTLQMLPLYEAKMTQLWNHRAADVVISPTAVQRQAQPSAIPVSDLKDRTRLAQPNYWVREDDCVEALRKVNFPGYLMGFTNITSATNERTCLPTLLPMAGVGHSMPLLFTSQSTYLNSALISNISSFIFDFCVRQKLGGVNMTYHYVKQFPVLLPSAFIPNRLSFIAPRVLELTYTAHDLSGFAADLGYAGEPFTWNDERRFWLRAELDALYFILYGIERDDVAYIMDTFPIVRRKDEAAHGGVYRTRDSILSVYDELQALGLERLGEYGSRVDGGVVAGGWMPA